MEQHFKLCLTSQNQLLLRRAVQSQFFHACTSSGISTLYFCSSPVGSFEISFVSVLVFFSNNPITFAFTIVNWLDLHWINKLHIKGNLIFNEDHLQSLFLLLLSISSVSSCLFLRSFPFWPCSKALTLSVSTTVFILSLQCCHDIGRGGAPPHSFLMLLPFSAPVWTTFCFMSQHCARLHLSLFVKSKCVCVW